MYFFKKPSHLVPIHICPSMRLDTTALSLTFQSQPAAQVSDHCPGVYIYCHSCHFFLHIKQMTLLTSAAVLGLSPTQELRKGLKMSVVVSGLVAVRTHYVFVWLVGSFVVAVGVEGGERAS